MLLNSESFEHSKIKSLPYIQLHERRLLLQTPVPTILPSRNISSLRDLQFIIERWLCHTPLPSFSLQKYGNYASVSWKSIRNIFNTRNCTSTYSLPQKIARTPSFRYERYCSPALICSPQYYYMGCALFFAGDCGLAGIIDILF